MVHVHVVEALGRHVALHFDQRVVWAAHVGEAGTTDGLHAGLLRFVELGAREPEDAAGARERVAVDVHRRPIRIAGVERQQRDPVGTQPRHRLALVGDVPAEMPERGLRLRRRRLIDLGEQDQHVVRRLQRVIPPQVVFEVLGNSFAYQAAAVSGFIEFRWR